MSQAPKAKKASSTTNRLTWNDEQQLELLRCVVLSGVHVAEHGTGAEKWLQTTKAFFNTDTMVAHKPTGIIDDKGWEDHSRKIKEAYKKIRARIASDMETANKSGREGDLSELFQLAKQIQDEIEDKNEEKELAQNQQNNLNEIAGKVVAGKADRPGPNPLKRKNLDGSIEDRSDDRAPMQSWQEAIVERFTQKPPSVAPGSYPEEIVERQLVEWIAKERKSIDNLIEEGGIDNPAAGELLKEVTLSVLINVYCTRDGKFSADKFKGELQAMEISAISRHKIFATLERWRGLACSSQANELVTPLESAVRSSSFPSTGSSNDGLEIDF